jgi:uncharacterized protein YbjQ (UPF0145 family)
MNKKLFTSGILGVALVFAIAVIGLGGCATTMKENFSGKSENITVGVKDFTAVDLVFVETVVTKGNGEKITYDALMKAAAEKDADAIVNVTIDVKKDGTKFLWFYLNPRETWYGSALAIKYTESIHDRDAPISNDKGGIQTSGTSEKKFLGRF